MRTMLSLLLLCSSGTAAFAGGDPVMWWKSGGPRVRPADSRMATLLRAGLDRSPTLRDLVERLEDGNVIVYLEMRPRIRSGLSGCLTWLTASGSFRYVRASINPELAADAQIAAIGHELQHALEIARHPPVTSEGAMHTLYRGIGEQRGRDSDAWDTVEARAVGETVRRELHAMPAATTADARSPITPRQYYRRPAPGAPANGPRR